MMQPSVLAKNMLDLFRANMQLLSPGAKPTEFQQSLTTATAKGLIEVLSKTGIVGISPAPVAVGNGFGLLVQPDIMQKAAEQYMLIQTGGSKGVALDLILKSMMVPIAKHLADSVEVISQTGFGGQGLPLQVSDDVISASIIKELPAKTVSNITRSKQGRNLIDAIAVGLSIGLQTSVPGFVPIGTVPPPPGLMQATLK